MDLHRHGSRKFPNAGLLASSRERAWSGVAAELRSHPGGDLPAMVPTQMEVTLATRRCPGAFVSRKGAGIRQRTAVEAGTIWLCPVGVGEDDINISAPLEDVLHIYLPSDRFASLADAYGDARVRADAVRYLADVDDPLIRQVGLVILGELLRESSAGRMMVEAAALTLTARIAQAHGHDGPDLPSGADEGIRCPARIRRAIEFMQDNLDRNLTVSEIAEIACLSPFHFARTFKRATGKTPHAFVSAERLQRARKLLAQPSTSMSEIALRSGFSGQAAFGTAFKRVVGCTPGEFRKLVSGTGA